MTRGKQRTAYFLLFKFDFFPLMLTNSKQNESIYVNEIFEINPFITTIIILRKAFSYNTSLFFKHFSLYILLFTILLK